jgi:hypothetical protein
MCPDTTHIGAFMSILGEYTKTVNNPDFKNAYTVRLNGTGECKGMSGILEIRYNNKVRNTFLSCYYSAFGSDGEVEKVEIKGNSILVYTDGSVDEILTFDKNGKLIQYWSAQDE